MRTWQGFRKQSGFGSVSVAVMSGYREILRIPSRPNVAPAQTAKALTGIALDKPTAKSVKVSFGGGDQT